jgi:hypothetical protein
MGFRSANLVLATVKGAKESWAVVTDEPPTLQTLWQYALRFRVEELFLDSKSGAFELGDSRLRSTDALERLYLVAAIGLLYATTLRHGSATGRLAPACRPALATRHQLSRALGCATFKGYSTKDGNCSRRFLYSLKTLSLVSPPSRLNNNSMTKFGSPASAPYPVNLD